MPQIALAGAAAWAGGAAAGALGLTSGTLAYSLVSAGTAYFVSDLLGDMLGLTPDMSGPSSTGSAGAERFLNVNARIYSGPINIIYGKAVNIGGIIAYQGVNSSPAYRDRKYLDTVVTLGVGEIEAIDTAYINEQNINDFNTKNSVFVRLSEPLLLPGGNRSGVKLTINSTEYTKEVAHSSDVSVQVFVDYLEANKGGETWTAEKVNDYTLAIRSTGDEVLVESVQVRDGYGSYEWYLDTDRYGRPIIGSDQLTDETETVKTGYWTYQWATWTSDAYLYSRVMPTIVDDVFVTTGENIGDFQINTYTGSDTQIVDADALANIEGWESTMAGAGIAYIYGRATFDKDKTNSIPVYTFDVRGRQIKNWNGSSWVTDYNNNAAWVIRDYLTDTVSGVGVDESSIDDDSFKAAALICQDQFFSSTSVGRRVGVRIATSNIPVDDASIRDNSYQSLSVDYKISGANLGSWTNKADILLDSGDYASDGSDIFSSTGKRTRVDVLFKPSMMQWINDGGIENHILKLIHPGNVGDFYKAAFSVTNETSSDPDNADYAVVLESATLTLTPVFDDHYAEGVGGTADLTFKVKENGSTVKTVVVEVSVSPNTPFLTQDATADNVDAVLVSFELDSATDQIEVSFYSVPSHTYSITTYEYLSAALDTHTFATPLSGDYYGRMYFNHAGSMIVGATDYGFVSATIDGVVDIDRKPIENVRDMLLSCRGLLSYTGGTFKLKIDALEASTVMDFDDTNITGSISVHLPSASDSFNRLKVSFLNAAKGMKADTFIMDSESIRDTLHNGKILEKQITFPYVTDASKARELALFSLKQSIYQIACSFVTFPEALQLEIGDIIRVSSDMTGWSNKKFRVMGLSLLEDGTVSVNGLEYQDSVYDLSTDDIDGVNIISSGGSDVQIIDSTIDAVGTTVIEEAVAPVMMPSATVEFDINSGSHTVVSQWAATLGNNIAETVVRLKGTAKYSSKTYDATVKTKNLSASFQSVDPGTYTLSFYNTSYKGKKSVIISHTITVAGGVKLPKPTHLSIDTGDEERIGDNSTIWGGKDCKIMWSKVSLDTAVDINDNEPDGADGNLDPTLSYEVETYDASGNLLLTEIVPDNFYTFTYDENAKSTGGPHRGLSFKVYTISTHGNYNRSEPAIL